MTRAKGRQSWHACAWQIQTALLENITQKKRVSCVSLVGNARVSDVLIFVPLDTQQENTWLTPGLVPGACQEDISVMHLLRSAACAVQGGMIV